MNKKAFHKAAIERLNSYEGDDYQIISTTVKIPKALQKVKCKGNSIWEDSKGKICTCTSARLEYHISNCDGAKDIEADSYYLQVFVTHDKNWEIYTDTGFEEGISKVLSKILGFKVNISFTEQGKQNDKCASLENSCRDKESWKLAAYIFEKGE